MLASRRPKARKITTAANDGTDDAEDAGLKAAAEAPTFKPRPNKPKKRPSAGGSSRLSFGGGGGGGDEGEEADELVFVPKKSALSRKAMERNAARKAAAATAATATAPHIAAGGSVGMERLSLAPAQERVSYSKEYLEQLRKEQQTAVAPAELEDGDTIIVDGDEAIAASSKGMEVTENALVPAAATTTRIMDDGMIRIMKARRRDRAETSKHGAKDFISLNEEASGSGSDSDSLKLRIKKKKKHESRLTRPDDPFDDEDMAAFVEDDEKLLLTKSRKARREQERKRKEAIRETIAEAEGADDDDPDGSDVSRDSLEVEFERDQIRKGAFSSEHAARGLEAELEAIARHPPMPVPLPDIKDVVERLEATLMGMELQKARTERQIEMLILEKSEIREQEEMLQSRMKEVGKQYEKLKRESGLGGDAEGVVSRGLESFGDTPIRVGEE